MSDILSLFVEMGDEKAAAAAAKSMMQGYWTLTDGEHEAMSRALDRPFMGPDAS